MERTEQEIIAAQKKYLQHRRGAKKRGIDFMLSYAEWQQWWDDSGHWHERGVRSEQYVMARKGDRGGYSLDNIECITSKQNRLDAVTNRVMGRKRKDAPQEIINPHPYQADTGLPSKPPKPPKPPKFSDLPIQEQEGLRRQWAISGLDTKKKNGTSGRGGCPKGIKRSLETRAKMSQSALNRKPSSYLL